MSGNAVAFYAGLPLLLTMFGDFFGGLATDWAVRIVGPRYGRAGVGFAAYLLAGFGMLAAAASPSAEIAATLFALGTAASMFLLGAAWGTCQDIGGGHAGVVSATMNTAGQCGAMACPLLVIFVKNRWGWDAPWCCWESASSSGRSAGASSTRNKKCSIDRGRQPRGSCAAMGPLAAGQARNPKHKSETNPKHEYQNGPVMTFSRFGLRDFQLARISRFAIPF